VYLLPCTTL